MMKFYPYLQEALALTLEKLRKEKKMTKTKLADFADLQDRYLLSISKGERNPSLRAIYSLCEALDVPVISFLDMVENERKRMLADGKNS